jgi:hypothetical protein
MAVEQLELHPAWPELTDRQREAINEIWDDTVVPALEKVREAEDARIEAVIAAQDARWLAGEWQRRYEELRWSQIDRDAA